MNEDIRLFGFQISPKPLDVREKLPLLYHNDYTFYTAAVAGVPCVFLRYRGDYLSMPRVRKHFTEIPKLLHSNVKCILWLNKVTAAQKTRLLTNQIPFFVDEKTAYIPFLGMILDLQANTQEAVFRNQFSAATQCVYLFLLFQKSEECRVKEIENQIRLSHVSVSAALKELHWRYLLEVTGRNTRKKYWRINRRKFWNEGRKYLLNPVMKRCYTDNLTEFSNIKPCYAGESALANLGMLSDPLHPCIAVNRVDWNKTKPQTVSSPNDLFSEQYTMVEVWRYNPGLFADKDNNVDVFSLYASLGELMEDERIAKEMNGLIQEVLDGSGD